MRKVFTLCAVWFLGTQVHAQFNYDVSVQNSAYQQLTTGTLINTAQAVDDTVISIPIGFQFSMDGASGAMMNLHFTERGFYWDIDATTVTTNTGFFMMEPDINNRADTPGDVIMTPYIRYNTTGAAGSKIFTAELTKSGFFQEYRIYGTRLDSFNIQLRLYEGSNIVELIFGPSRITHTSDYFANSSGPVLGYIRNYDPVRDSFDVLYYLSGNVAGANIDSTHNYAVAAPLALNGFPGSGIMYRFQPVPSSIATQKPSEGMYTLNTICFNLLTINNQLPSLTSYRIISLQGSTINLHGGLNLGRNDIDVSMLPRGMYILNLYNDTEQKAVRIVKM